MEMHLIFVEAPWRKMRSVNCEIHLCKKSAWAEYRGRRFKIGVSAFQTVEAATLQRTKRLKDLVADYGFKGSKPKLWVTAFHELEILQNSSRT